MDGDVSLNAVLAALGAALLAAPYRERQRLADAIADYTARFPGSFSDIRSGGGQAAATLRAFLEELVEAVDAFRQ